MTKHIMTDTSPIAFDIETEGYPKELQLSMFEPKMKIDGRLSKPESIEADRIKKTDEWCEQAPLDAARAKVLCIGVMKGECVNFIEGEEKTVIEELWTTWIQHRHSQFVGHYIKGFDLPFLYRRSMVLGIYVPNDIFEGRYFSPRFFDTMETWTRGTRDTISLDNLSRALGVGKKNGDGKDFAALYRSDREKALEYLANDCALTMRCALKLGVRGMEVTQ